MWPVCAGSWRFWGGCKGRWWFWAARSRPWLMLLLTWPLGRFLLARQRRLLDLIRGKQVRRFSSLALELVVRFGVVGLGVLGAKIKDQRNGAITRNWFGSSCPWKRVNMAGLLRPWPISGCRK